MTFPENFPIRTVTPLRISLLEQRAIRPLYEAAWVHGRDIGNLEVLQSVLQTSGLDVGLILRADQMKEALVKNTMEAERLGVCG